MQREGVASTRSGERSCGAASAWWSGAGAFVACAVALGACAEGLPGAEGEKGSDASVGDRGGGARVLEATSGTRITATKQLVTTTTVTSDGARSVTTSEEVGWFDSQRNEPCSFRLAGDGRMRCLPLSRARGDVSGGIYFLDGGCTERLAITPKLAGGECGATTSPAPQNAVYLSVSAEAENGCTGTTIRQIKNRVVTTTVYQKSGANCFEIDARPELYDYLLPGAEIAPTEFVEQRTTIVRQ